jgi:hypothetical protein
VGGGGDEEAGGADEEGGGGRASEESGNNGGEGGGGGRRRRKGGQEDGVSGEDGAVLYEHEWLRQRLEAAGEHQGKLVVVLYSLGLRDTAGGVLIRSSIEGRVTYAGGWVGIGVRGGGGAGVWGCGGFGGVGGWQLS